MYSKIYFGILILILHRKSNCHIYHFKKKVLDSCAIALLILNGHKSILHVLHKLRLYTFIRSVPRKNDELYTISAKQI